MSEKISMTRRLRLEANALGEFQAYASRDYRRMLLDAAEEIERLRKERDEARREICVMLEDATNNHRENHAKRWGWDCYKENTDA
jgi:hypothetical protein